MAGYIYNSGGGTVTNNFALESMSGGANYNGYTNSFSNSTIPANHGTDKTIDNLKTQSTYSGMPTNGLGWSFGDNDTNPWKIEGNNYPHLYWQDL